MRHRALLGAIFALTSCASSTSAGSPTASAIRVAIAFFPIEDIVVAMSGTQLQVTNITPPGASAHDYEPTPQQVADLEKAKLVFYLGDGFQPSIEKAIASLPDSVAKVDLLQSVTLLDKDPHVWLDPANMMLMAATVHRALLQLPGLDHAALDAAAKSYGAKLIRTAQSYESTLSSCQHNDVVTSHDAFGYLARRYGLRNIPIAGISPQDEPSAKDLEGIAQVARDFKVTTVFFEENLPSDLAKTVADEIGARVAVLDSIESPTQMQLDAGASYESIMLSNLAVLKQGLTCQ